MNIRDNAIKKKNHKHNPCSRVTYLYKAFSISLVSVTPEVI